MTFFHRDSGTSVEDWASDPRAAGLQELRLGDEMRRLVVVAAHPDDESLGAGGLINRSQSLGIEVMVIVATDGEASHPSSPTHTPAQLATVRRLEVQAAIDALCPAASTRLLGFPDGGLAAHESDLLVALVELVGDGRHTLVVAPWRRDGHADHEVAGRAAATAAARTGAQLLEYPIWLWHWGTPNEVPWESLQVLRLAPSEATAKTVAQSAHRSQVEPLSDQPGDEALLSGGFLEHFGGVLEPYVVEDPVDTSLDDLHAEQSDPWGADSRWYEKRKRSLLMSVLPRQTFRHGLEIGSSTGALAEELAGRCADLLVVDASVTAATAAISRLQHLDHVRVDVMQVPAQWPAVPTGGFDLVVVSEVGYFLSPRALDDLIERVRTDLALDGVLILCHWRHEVVGWPLDGADVHRIFVSAGVRPVVAEYRDRDVEVLVLARPDELPDPGTS